MSRPDLLQRRPKTADTNQELARPSVDPRRENMDQLDPAPNDARRSEELAIRADGPMDLLPPVLDLKGQFDGIRQDADPEADKALTDINSALDVVVHHIVDLEEDELAGDKTAFVHQHTTPKFLPPREDMRTHLDEEVKDELDNDPDLKKEASVEPGLLRTAAEKLAWSNAVKNEVIKRWGNTPTAKALGEEGLDQLLDTTERLVPVGPKTKPYMLWLVGQHLAPNPPAWQPGEDDAVIRPMMFDFDKLCTGQKLKGPQADINSYKALDQLRSAVQKAQEAEKSHEPEVVETDDEEAAKGRFDVKRKRYLPQDIADIKAGSTVVAQAGGWTVYKIRKSPDEAGKAAAQLLCNNGINKVSWCVGRGTLSYLDQGPFYVLVKGNRSTYAISTVTSSKSATIWNPADTPVWVTTQGGGDPGFTNLSNAASAKGIELDFTQISSLPAEVVPILEAAVGADPELAQFIPTHHLVQGDTKNLDRAIMSTPTQGLVQDLANAFSSERTTGLGAAVMGRCIAMHYDFSPEYSEFNENLLVAYIELLAAAGQKLPDSLETAIIEAIEATV